MEGVFTILDFLEKIPNSWFIPLAIIAVVIAILYLIERAFKALTAYYLFRTKYLDFQRRKKKEEL